MKLVLATRLVLGVFYVLSGANWFLGFMPMLPHVGMPPDMPMKHAVIAEMIQTGWLFQCAKVIELAFGMALLANRFVPLMLAVALPVAFITFMLDALILDDLGRWLAGTEDSAAMRAAVADMIVGGLCVLLPHLWLIWCYFDYYRPALSARADPAAPGERRPEGATAATIPPHRSSIWPRRLFLASGLIAFGFQAFNLWLFLGMIRLK